MVRLKIDLLGISELHWTGNGYFQSKEFIIYYSGHDNTHRNGVAFIASKQMAQAVEGFSTVNDRIMTIRIRAKPINITVVQVYALTTDANEPEIEDFYATIEVTLRTIPKKDIIYILGNFNAKLAPKQRQESLEVLGWEKEMRQTIDWYNFGRKTSFES